MIFWPAVSRVQIYKGGIQKCSANQEKIDKEDFRVSGSSGNSSSSSSTVFFFNIVREILQKNCPGALFYYLPVDNFSASGHGQFVGNPEQPRAPPRALRLPRARARRARTRARALAPRCMRAACRAPRAARRAPHAACACAEQKLTS